MKAQLRQLANRALRPLGFELIRASGTRPLMAEALRRTAAHGFGLRSVIDIGAAAGSWSAMALPVFPEARFLAIEPLKERVPELAALKARQPRFDYALCVAGEEEGGTAHLNVAADLDGSTVEGHGGERRAVPVRSLVFSLLNSRIYFRVFSERREFSSTRKARHSRYIL